MFTENVSKALIAAGYEKNSYEYAKVMAAASNMQNDVERSYNNAVLELKAAAEALQDYDDSELTDLIGELSQSVATLSEEHASIAATLESLLGSSGSITQTISDIKDNVKKDGSLEKTIGLVLAETATTLGSQLSGKVDDVKTSVGNVKTAVDTVKTSVGNVKTTVDTAVETLSTKVASESSAIKTKVADEHTSTRNKIQTESNTLQQKIASETAGNNKTKQILDKIESSKAEVVTTVGSLEGNLASTIANSTESVAVSAARRAHDEYLNQQNAWISMLKFNIDDWMRTATQIASDQAVLNYATNKFTTAVTTLDKFFGLLSDLEIQAHSWWEVVDSLSDTKVYMSKVMDENKNMVNLIRDMIKHNETRENIKIATEVANTTLNAATYADSHKASRRWG